VVRRRYLVIGMPVLRIRERKETRCHNRAGTAPPAVNCRPRCGDSSQAAQDTFTEARDDAVQTYGEGEQADMAAFASLKKQFEKCGDHWIARPAPAG
jgi:hypothetical protein